MTQGITTSIRLDPKLSKELEKAAKSLNRGKNWIISQALVAYLSRLQSQALMQEAKRQSLLAKKLDEENLAEQITWEENGDTTGWS